MATKIIFFSLTLALLAFMPWTYHTTYMKYFIMQAGAVALLLLWLWKERPGTGHFRKMAWLGTKDGRGILLLLAFLAWNFLSVIWAEFHLAAYYRSVELFFYALWAMMVYSALPDGKRFARFIDLFICLGACAAFIGLVFFAFPAAYRLVTMSEYNQRLMLPFGSPLFASAFQMLIMPVTLSRIFECFISAKNDGRDWLLGRIAHNRAFLITAFLFQLIAFIFSFSISALAGLIAAVIIALVIALPKYRPRIIIGVIAVLIIAVMAVLLSTSIRAELESKFAEGSIPSRYFGAKISLGIAADHPVWGAGAGGFFPNHAKYSPPDRHLYHRTGNYMLHAHNEYLEILAETGCIGIILFLLGIYFVFRKVIRHVCGAGNETYKVLSNPVLGLFVGVIAVMAQDTGSVGLRFWDVSIFFWAAFAAMLAGIRPEKKEEYVTSGKKNFLGIGVAAVVSLLAGALFFFAGYRGLASEMKMRDAVKSSNQYDKTQIPAYGQMTVEILSEMAEYRGGYNYSNYAISEDMLGRMLLQLQYNENGYKVFDVLQGICPGMDNSVYLMGEAKLALGDRTAAADKFILYARANPFDVVGQERLGLVASGGIPEGLNLNEKEKQYLKALGFYYKNDYDNALNLLLGMATDGIGIGFPLRLKGVCLIAVGDMQSARAALTTHLQQYYADIYARLMLAATIIDDYSALDKELAICSRLADGAPNAQMLFSRISILRGRGLGLQNRWAESVRQFEKSLQLMPDNFDTYFDLAGAYWMNGDDIKAELVVKNLYSQAFGDKKRMTRVDVFVNKNRARRYMMNGYPAEAAKCLEKAIQNSTEDPDLFFGLFDIYSRHLKRNDLANQTLERFISLTKNSRLKLEARRLLDNLNSEKN